MAGGLWVGKLPKEATTKLRSEGRRETLGVLQEEHSSRGNGTCKSLRQERTGPLKGWREVPSPCRATSWRRHAGRCGQGADPSWALALSSKYNRKSLERFKSGA